MNQNNEENLNSTDIEEEVIQQAESELNNSNKEELAEDYSTLKFKLSVKEIVRYSIVGVIFLTGVILGVLGICAVNIGSISTNPIFQAERNFSIFLKRSTILDFRVFGAILMVIAMVGFIISTIVFMNKFIKEKASKKKYNERLRILMSSDLAKLDEQEDFEKEKKKQAQKE